MSQDQAEQNIQMWKVKKLVKSLDSARGCAPPYPMSYHDIESGLILQRWDFYDHSYHTSQGISLTRRPKS
jgi:hypothetical protein